MTARRKAAGILTLGIAPLALAGLTAAPPSRMVRSPTR